MYEIEEVGRLIVDSAIQVHRALGPGLLESAYQQCLTHELKKRGLDVNCEVTLPIAYESIKVDAGYRVDMVIERSVLVENKTVEQLLPVHHAQMQTYLKLGNFRLGFLLNWNVIRMKDGIHRVVNGMPEPSWRGQGKSYS